MVGDYASHQTVTTRNDFVLRRGAVKTMNVLFIDRGKVTRQYP